MKAKMYSAESNTRLHKTIDEFFISHDGIKNLKRDNVIKEDEYVSLVDRNIAFFLVKIREFRITEKMVCVVFACLFGYMQVNADDFDLQRKGRRPRGRRRNETENPTYIQEQ